MLRFVSIAVRLVVSVPVLPGQAQSVYEWIEVDGLSPLPPEGKLFIKTGTTSETITVTKQIEVFTPSGPVIVGE